jgi:hypothetical protein
MTILRNGASRMADRLNRFAKVDKSGGASSISVPSNSVKWEPKEAGVYNLSIVPYIITKPGHPDASLLGEEFAIGDDWYRRPYGIHRNIGGKQIVICPKTTFGLPCPICELKWELGKNYEANKAQISALKPKRQVMYNIYVKGGFQIFDMSDFKFGEMLEKEIEQAEDKSVAGFSLLQNGKTLKVRFVKATYEGRNFFKADRIDFENRPALDVSILEQAPKLDDCVKCMSYEDIKALLAGPVSATTQDDDPEPEQVVLEVKQHAPKAVTIEVADEEPVVAKPPPMHKILKHKEASVKTEVALIDEDWN